MLRFLQVSTGFSLLLFHCSLAYELQDTIHTLKEENMHLQHRLENLTRALRDLKHLLAEHAKENPFQFHTASGEHNTEYLHAWKDWSQHGVSAETYQMLEQAFCLTELHGAARRISIIPGFLLLSPLISMLLPLLS